MPRSPIPCILFAGGKSSRMGKNKAQLPFSDGKTLMEYQVHRLQELFDQVYLSVKEKESYTGIDAKAIIDIEYSNVYAPTAGFYNIFKQLQDDDLFFVLSVDTPFVNAAIIQEILSYAHKGYDAVIARTKRSIHPLCGLYSRTLQPPIEQMLQEENHRMMQLLQSTKVKYVDIDDEDALLNLNTPQEYQQALNLLRQV